MSSRRLWLIFVLISFTYTMVWGSDLYVEKRNGEIKVYSFNFKEEQLVEKKNNNIKTPLGSLWKLFIYTYNKENSLSSSPYRCKGNLNQEIFCCKKGESIDEDDALAKSCGLFFSPSRLQISKKKWKDFW